MANSRVQEAIDRLRRASFAWDLAENAFASGSLSRIPSFARATESEREFHAPWIGYLARPL